MRGRALPFTPMKTYGLIYANLREKLKLLSLKSFSLSSHAHSRFLLLFFFFCLLHINFSSSFFSSLISFLSLFYFSFHLIFSFGPPSPVEIKWAKFPPTFPLGHLSSPYLSSYFPLFSFILFIASCNTWFNVSHIFQVYNMALTMCHSIGVPYGIT